MRTALLLVTSIALCGCESTKPVAPQQQRKRAVSYSNAALNQRGDRAPSLLLLEIISRDAVIAVWSNPAPDGAPLFSASTPDGLALAPPMPLDQLRLRYPGLYTRIRGAYAEPAGEITRTPSWAGL